MIRAAGAVVWRGDPSTPEVLIVHRPRYDDWSLPKGKFDADEHPMAAAVREVKEETGYRVVLGPALPSVDYVSDGVDKRTDYWSAEAVEGEFVVNDEVDEAKWLSVEDAVAALSYPMDAEIVRVFASQPRPSQVVVVLRHAKAESRSGWSKHDSMRPLNGKGFRQAEAIAELFSTVLPPLTVATSPWLRCHQTVVPYAERVAAPVLPVPSLGEDEFDADPPAAAAEFRALLANSPAVLVCSHGNVTPDLAALSSDSSHSDPAIWHERPLPKGGFVVIHRDSTGREISTQISSV